MIIRERGLETATAGQPSFGHPPVLPQEDVHGDQVIGVFSLTTRRNIGTKYHRKPFAEAQTIFIDHDHDCWPEEKKPCGKCVRGLLQAVCDDLLEASVPDQFKDASRSLAVDWTDLETFSRPPPHGTRDCAGPEASWGHRRNNLLRSENELFFGYYFDAGTMEREENGAEVPELTRRMTVCSCRRDPARALVPS